MPMIEKSNQWLVLYTRPRWEKKVAQLLEEKGITNYCPLNKVTKKWSDRNKVVLEPLFKGYVFVHIADAVKWEVKKVNGVLNYVHWLGKPAVVSEQEIFTIKKFMQEFDEVQVVDPHIAQDSRVVVKQGLLMDYEGIVLEVTGNLARVKIESMGVTLMATFDKKNLHLSLRSL